MIDPDNPPKLPDATQAELEEFIMFGIAAAGKNARLTAIGLDYFINSLPNEHSWDGGPLARPLARLASWRASECHRLPCNATGWDGGWSRETQVRMLGKLVKQAGLGCYNQRAASFLDLLDRVAAGLDLRTCTIEELEQVRGIGKKTSRFFVVYTRPEQHDYAILDVHILSWMQEQGYQVPDQTPTTASMYKWAERMFIKEAASRGITPLELDQAIWKTRRIK